MEIAFHIMPTTPPKSTSPTKINIITSSIPLPTARIMNLTFLSLGTSLNIFVILIIISKSSMRTAMNLYLISLACSNMVILIEPFEETLRWFFDVNTKLNMDYVCLISFDVSVITIAIMKFQLYINIFQQHTVFGQRLSRKLTAIKGIFLIWSSCIISLAIGLHIYDFFEGDMADIYVWNTFMFIIMPFLIFIALDSLILYELMILKAIEGSWRSRELRHYVMLG
ncbi:PREDICTED: thyrotropin-releasing hormone receptor-like [Dufourea novaeangliae]|uniref:thyrotropin-releasing hormone receptor-like n=1 Tax=Dufourea novaeangliae TaxID=178035 RepID=UPI000767B304|nr:PREDICTED: thyrotropin-releasing hormone receptor-like [Dufourea novaeangliae]